MNISLTRGFWKVQFSEQTSLNKSQLPSEFQRMYLLNIHGSLDFSQVGAAAERRDLRCGRDLATVYLHVASHGSSGVKVEVQSLRRRISELIAKKQGLTRRNVALSQHSQSGNVSEELQPTPAGLSCLWKMKSLHSRQWLLISVLGWLGETAGIILHA